MIPYLDLSPEVSSALRSKQPVVALESTIISHGMPYPRNVETALQVEAIVRKNGAIPATIAVINGRMKAGLSKQEITNLGKLGTAVLKVSRRDLPVVIAQGQNGATTVAATMIIADLAGISIFATGGIGGVHRGASESMDVSADLQELARTNVAVVCAGAKSILDLGLTLEYLETQGVPVLGYQTSEFPAFYTRNSGFKVDQSVDSAEELADILTIKWQLGLKGGAVIANPIPLEFQLEYAVMEQAIQQALAKAEKKNIKGKEITPFLLASIEQITRGKSLDANVELVLNNAKLAAQIAEYLRVS
ncbi:pseudouridine-5'-phosphate glycosidase [Haliscomenobacter hydrossis]|uniref:Pseudouridine-5'-phosphate glycosidase n=1 Tax=Haliscomenobacter hydrossis (strain ATCC 27775 / DSM 1100 / LMG 10767 / O) TaxID=760192 RepID=F4L222_HALH1|nr:pseudouridine-5'-phosphate glycosidase [Haliscomenobacter hydrossis]AEE50655.1 Pseudouridine-5'-phosphate glycosidase [Haliscomenobacter hydrossis DSM 1100]